MASSTGSVGVAQDVDQQEHQDAGRQGVEERPAPLAGERDPPERQAEEDGGPGDGREHDRLGGRHGFAPLGDVVRLA